MLKIIFMVSFGIVIFLIISLLVILRNIHKQRKLTRELLKNKLHKQIEEAKESIFIIIDAMQKGNCDYAEGALRLYYVIRPLDINFEKYYSLNEIYQNIKDLAICEERQKLSSTERKTQDKIRLNVIEKNKNLISEELIALKKEVELFKYE